VEKKFHFQGIAFESTFGDAVREDGLTVKFTRSEKRVLSELVRKPGSILSRERLLDAISGPGSDASDRNIDFLINRLRRKLDDPARTPKFIATHYGEGYSWIAPRIAERPPATGAFIVVGPIRGLNHIGDFSEQALSFARNLHAGLNNITADDRPVVLDPNCPPADAFLDGAPKYGVDLNFIGSGSALQCVMTLKVFASGQILRATRQAIVENPRSKREGLDETIDTLADDLTTAIWDSVALQNGGLEIPTSEPLAISMVNAAMLFSGDLESWRANDRRLRTLVAKNENDHVARLMLATNIHSKYILAGMQLFTGPDPRAHDEDEMERLVTGSLPHLQHNAIYALAAAKLLFFLDRGYQPLAIRMAETAFESSTALAVSLAIFGQMRMYLGEIDEALDAFDRAHELSEDASEFDAYLLVVKCQALLAAGKREALERELRRLYEIRPGAKFGLALFFTSVAPDKITPEAKQVLAHIDLRQANAMLLYVYYICARLFRYGDHRENIMRVPLTLLAERFGYDFMPDEIRRSVPSLLPVEA